MRRSRILNTNRMFRLSRRYSENQPSRKFERLALVSSGDIIVVGPVGGDGTELEEALVFHDNIIRKATKSAPAKPMIILETRNETSWGKILQTKFDLLYVAKKDLNAYSWLHAVSSVEEFKDLIGIF
jgi:hypothetical protein